MTKHTPRPWRVNDGTHCASIYDAADDLVADTVRSPRNARLIAAAPEMLMALKDIAARADAGALSYDDHELRSLLEEIRDLYARAAIAKATGEA